MRHSGTTCNLVSMHIDDVPATSQGLLREKWSLRQMETSDAHGNLLHSKGDRFHMCFTKWHALKLVKNDMVLMLDTDLDVVQCPDESSELPAPAAIKQGSRIRTTTWPITLPRATTSCSESWA